MKVEVFDYDSRYQEDFERLNVEWLEKYFRVEEVDAVTLGDPDTHIINHGGHILFARLDDEVVGTVALKHQGDGVFELTKMAVTESCQGKGVGKILLDAAVARFKSIDGRSMYLESHSSLAPALGLYERAGFMHTPRPEPSVYERADVYMVYKPEN